ncbi:Wadjet anti-phage system protein JetD domain-containing protein [Isoptericola variabilis]|uniref:Wadjet anti-phage system protein JetD domain-containing protein n=1 Tax=Isoptericola variabilis TaxID=139208 RepID=UPI0009D99511|nr:Wadjet anti-phage system protein JetD domain-containing protein [Isoptericola variabilis]
MVTVDAARASILRTYERGYAAWAALGPSEETVVDVPLHPPSERTVLGDPRAVADWIAAWRAADPGAPGTAHVVWETRRWASMGTQVVPARLRLTAAEHVASFVRRRGHWDAARTRAAALLELLGPDNAPVREAVRRALRAVVELDEPELGRLLGVLRWLLANSASGMFVRQLPVRGVDTKWLERHRGVVDPLWTAATGTADLGLAARPGLVRVRFLDPASAPGGLGDVSAPVADLAGLAISPPTVLVVENLETLLALRPHAGVVAVHGQGYAARHLHQLPWVRPADVLYWGDLDTHGLNILSIVRARLPQTRSFLMDRATLEAYPDLWVPEPKPHRTVPEHLTASEADAFAALSEHGDVRLEQERVPWASAVEALDALLETCRSTRITLPD